ncbi:Borealin N terminal-domain-containing protein [Xylariaceae sp. FL0016]|nr:Borealin N terminal-domain-containing protein [Xylariaceae sp. FL0016]
MSPVTTRKRKSDESPMASSPGSSPNKRRKMGISLAQKQALIDNLQLEITERARRLRAQYNVQAQQLRSRVEMRVNRIPTTLRKLKMGDLLEKSLKPQPSKPTQAPYVAKPPPVPAKDGTSPKIARKPVPPSTRGRKRLSDDISADKENQGDIVMENPKKKTRGAPAKTVASVETAQVLSPTSSNSRLRPVERPASPAKSMIARPASPVKGPSNKSSTNLLSSMVEKAKATRPAAITRKTTTSPTASSNPAPTRAPAARARKAAAPPSAAATRGRRKISATSESSESSNATVVRKTTTSRAAKQTAPASKRTVMGTIKSATTKKAPAAKPAASTATGGRTLRKRG